MFICGLSLAGLWSCNNPAPLNISANPVFQYTVTLDSSITKLPALQSFVLASYNQNWIMFSGRTNGFHGFNTGPLSCDTCSADFPVNRSNDSIYVYAPGSDSLYSMVIPSYGGDTGNVFRCTNLEHTEQGQYMYACGGYGIANAGDTVATKTYSYFMKMDMPKMISAVKANNPGAFKQSIMWGQSDMVCATGGEMFLLPDNNFYLVVGHKFTGAYLDPNAIQEYVDSVRVFTVSTSGNQLVLNRTGSFTDNFAGATTYHLHDSLTQFRRRDLVIAPAVQSNGTDIGISVYGGVFHYTPGSPSANNGNPFINPIYINPLLSPKFRIDSAQQYTNIYSAAFLAMYDTTSKTMMTSLFGGLGNSKDSLGDANWTNLIITNHRCYKDNKDTTKIVTNGINLPALMGAESIFIPAEGIPYYNSNYRIVDYGKLGNTQLVGYIYGGIVSISADGNGSQPTHASGAVYKVTLNKEAD